MQHPPSALHNSSPLDSLVRRTSTRRAELTTLDTTPPRPSADPAMQAQYSPILHTRFRTASTGTALTEFGGHDRNRSDAQSTSSWGAQDESFRERERDRSREREWDGASSYAASQQLGASSWAPGARGKSMVESMYSQASHDYDGGSGEYRGSYQESWKMGDAGPPAIQAGAIPSVVVSEEPERPLEHRDHWPQPPITQMHPAGRTPSAVPGGSVNFSHPRVALVTDRATENRKLEVYKRNQQRPGTAGSSRSVGRSPLSQHESAASASRPSTSMSSHSRNDSGGAASTASSMLPSQARWPSPPMTQLQGSHSTPSLPLASSSSRSISPSNAPPRPPRPASPVSLYSHYSYYPMDSPLPSPTTPNAPMDSPATTHLSPNYVPSPHSDKSPPSPAPQPTKPTSSPQPNLDNPQTAQDYLQLGITHHEANRLTESAACFEKSATLGGGCGVGMLMWGLAQRHGWGCPQNEASGFRWLRRAAEVAVEDLEKARAGADSGAVKSELVLAIYEVGQSFFRGWGVEKDKKMAVVRSTFSLVCETRQVDRGTQSYFRVAARLGDPDAQQDLAFCLANGKGCKKDKKEAAKWYRAAVRANYAYISHYLTISAV